MPASELPVSINQTWEARVFTSKHLGEGSHWGICSVCMWDLLHLVLEHPNSKLAWRIGQSSHREPEHGPFWYLLGINECESALFRVPKPEFDLSTNAQVQEWNFVFEHQSGNWDPLRTCFALDPRQTTAWHTHDSLLCLCSKMESDRVKQGKYNVQSDLPDTSDVNTSLFCAAAHSVVSAQAPGVNSPSYYSPLRWYHLCIAWQWRDFVMYFACRGYFSFHAEWWNNLWWIMLSFTAYGFMCS